MHDVLALGPKLEAFEGDGSIFEGLSGWFQSLIKP
jgi:hypothetical protein